jgi:hypothetical protein
MQPFPIQDPHGSHGLPPTLHHSGPGPLIVGARVPRIDPSTAPDAQCRVLPSQSVPQTTGDWHFQNRTRLTRIDNEVKGFNEHRFDVASLERRVKTEIEGCNHQWRIAAKCLAKLDKALNPAIRETVYPGTAVLNAFIRSCLRGLPDPYTQPEDEVAAAFNQARSAFEKIEVPDYHSYALAISVWLAAILRPRTGSERQPWGKTLAVKMYELKLLPEPDDADVGRAMLRAFCQGMTDTEEPAERLKYAEMALATYRPFHATSANAAHKIHTEALRLCSLVMRDAEMEAPVRQQFEEAALAVLGKLHNVSLANPGSQNAAMKYLATCAHATSAAPAVRSKAAALVLDLFSQPGCERSVAAVAMVCDAACADEMIPMPRRMELVAAMLQVASRPELQRSKHWHQLIRLCRVGADQAETPQLMQRCDVSLNSVERLANAGSRVDRDTWRPMFEVCAHLAARQDIAEEEKASRVARMLELFQHWRRVNKKPDPEVYGWAMIACERLGWTQLLHQLMDDARADLFRADWNVMVSEGVTVVRLEPEVMFRSEAEPAEHVPPALAGPVVAKLVNEGRIVPRTVIKLGSDAPQALKDSVMARLEEAKLECLDIPGLGVVPIEGWPELDEILRRSESPPPIEGPQRPSSW